MKKYKSDILNEIIETEGHIYDSLHYESECKEYFINSVKGAYPKLCDYESEWLNYYLNQISNFPYETFEGTEGIAYNVVPFAYKTAIIQGDTQLDESNQSLVYVENPVLITTGKNLFDINQKFVTGNIGGTGSTLEGQYVAGVWQVSDFIKLNSNTDYYLSTNNFKFEKISFYDVNKNVIKGSNINGVNKRLISTSNTIGYIRIVIQKTDGGALSYDELVANNDIQLEKSSQATSYEPYQSITLSTSEEVILRGVNDEQDIINCLTGEITSYIGEYKIDGSKSPQGIYDKKGDTVGFYFPTNTITTKNYTSDLLVNTAICDKLPVKNHDYQSSSTVFLDEEFISISYDGRIGVRLLSTKASTVDEFCAYVSENPITIQYQLLSPITNHITLNIVNQNGETISTLKPIEGTMNIQSSSHTIAPKVILEYPIEAVETNLYAFMKED